MIWGIWAVYLHTSCSTTKGFLCSTLTLHFELLSFTGCSWFEPLQALFGFLCALGPLSSPSLSPTQPAEICLAKIPVRILALFSFRGLFGCSYLPVFWGFYSVYSAHRFPRSYLTRRFPAIPNTRPLWGSTDMKLLCGRSFLLGNPRSTLFPVLTSPHHQGQFCKTGYPSLSRVNGKAKVFRCAHEYFSMAWECDKQSLRHFLIVLI